MDEYNNAIIVLLVKTLHVDYSGMTKEIVANLKTCKFKVTQRIRILKHTKIFGIGYTEIFLVVSVMKTKPWTFRIEDLNRGKNN